MLNVKICTDNFFIKSALEFKLSETQKIAYRCSSNLLILDTTFMASDKIVKELTGNCCMALILIKDRSDEMILKYLRLPFPVYFIPLTASVDYVFSVITSIKVGLSQKRACYIKVNNFYDCRLSEKELITIRMLFNGKSKKDISIYLNTTMKAVHNLSGTAMRKLALKWSTRTYELFKILNEYIACMHTVNKSYYLDNACAIININMRAFSQSITYKGVLNF